MWSFFKTKANPQNQFNIAIQKLIKYVEAVNKQEFRNFVIKTEGGYTFIFERYLWVDYSIHRYDSWLIRTKTGTIQDCNVIYLVDDEQWNDLFQATEKAIAIVIEQEEQTKAKAMMDKLINN